MSGTYSSGFLFAGPYELALMSMAFKEENPFLMSGTFEVRVWARRKF
jgi:hypothetical protein